MKHIKTLMLLAVLPLLGRAQTKEQALQSMKDRKGWYIGTGIYYANQTTHWKYDQTSPAVGVPFYNAAEGFGHDVSRTLFILGIEKKSIFGTPKLREGIFVSRYDYHGNYLGTDYDPVFNFIDADFGADLMFNPSAKTTANWLNDNNNQISSGGLTASASAYIRFQWVVLFSSKLRISILSTSLGAQYTYVHNNGKGGASQPLVNDFNYSKGWNENIATLFFSVGILGIESGKFSITPEVRIFTLGTSSTTLKPERLIGNVKMEAPPTVVSYGIKVLKKL